MDPLLGSEINRVTALELTIIPDISGGTARASLNQMPLAESLREF
jgi:hypothetical protein